MAGAGAGASIDPRKGKEKLSAFLQSVGGAPLPESKTEGSRKSLYSFLEREAAKQATAAAFAPTPRSVRSKQEGFRMLPPGVTPSVLSFLPAESKTQLRLASRSERGMVEKAKREEIERKRLLRDRCLGPQCLNIMGEDPTNLSTLDKECQPLCHAEFRRRGAASRFQSQGWVWEFFPMMSWANVSAGYNQQSGRPFLQFGTSGTPVKLPDALKRELLLGEMVGEYYGAGPAVAAVAAVPRQILLTPDQVLPLIVESGKKVYGPSYEYYVKEFIEWANRQPEVQWVADTRDRNIRAYFKVGTEDRRWEIIYDFSRLFRHEIRDRIKLAGTLACSDHFRKDKLAKAITPLDVIIDRHGDKINIVFREPLLIFHFPSEVIIEEIPETSWRDKSWRADILFPVPAELKSSWDFQWSQLDLRSDHPFIKSLSEDERKFPQRNMDLVTTSTGERKLRYHISGYDGEHASADSLCRISNWLPDPLASELDSIRNEARENEWQNFLQLGY